MKTIENQPDRRGKGPGERTRKKRLIIPLFIPHSGCVHQCVFCNQTDITGRASLPTVAEVGETITAYLATWKGAGPREAAFYGGSFTGLDAPLQERLLGAVAPFVAAGEIDALRVSTRPDMISRDGVALLRRYRVKTVELGVQSMDDGVLRLSGRGHCANDTVRAVEELKRSGMTTGLQMVPGLPGDTAETIAATAREMVRLGPDFVRVYPTLVVRGTPLETMYGRGDYRPWSLEAMTSVCRDVVALFGKAGIPVIRVGLQPTAGLEESIVAGPYHPSFRQLLEASEAEDRPAASGE